MFRFLLAGLISLFSFSTAIIVTADTPKRDWTPSEENPDCLVKERFLATSEPIRGGYSPEFMILQSYVWGGEAVNQSAGQDMGKFEYDCLTKDAKGRCGIPYDKSISKIVKQKKSKYYKRVEARKFGGAIYELMDRTPPQSAIEFAEESLGLCFGEGGSGKGLTELGFTRINIPMKYCKSYAENMRVRYSNYSTEALLKVPQAERVQQELGWSKAIMNRTQTSYGPNTGKDSGACIFAPNMVAQILQTQYQKDLGKEKAAQAEAERYANRSVEERIAGLNGCQIAYGLVINELNKKNTDYKNIPNEAFTWAFNYDQANIQNKACPVMPTIVSDWVDRQSLDDFEAVDDPYTDMRRGNRNPGQVSTSADWDRFSRNWMSRYKTIEVTGEDCVAVTYHMDRQRNRGQDWDTPYTAFFDLSRIAQRETAWREACRYTPPKIRAQALVTWEAYRQRLIAQNTPAPPKPERRGVINYKPPAEGPKTYLWSNTPTTRCYWAGDTKYGQKQKCFTN